MTATWRPEQLARLPLVLAAVENATIIADRVFPPGADISVGSNSGNDLVIAERFELTAYRLVHGGCRLHLAPPLHVQAIVWHRGEPLELKGYFRDLRKTLEGLPEVLPLASLRFVVSYAHRIALMGRFQLPAGPGESDGA